MLVSDEISAEWERMETDPGIVAMAAEILPNLRSGALSADVIDGDWTFTTQAMNQARARGVEFTTIGAPAHGVQTVLARLMGYPDWDTYIEKTVRRPSDG